MAYLIKGAHVYNPDDLGVRMFWWLTTRLPQSEKI